MSENVNHQPVDRARWLPGPWDGEPDRVEWKTAMGLPGLIVRHPGSGHLCGYVAVNPGHPAHHKLDCGNFYNNGISVHGGITYASMCSGAVCHVPAPGEPDEVWWVGFDAAHSGDRGPSDAIYEAKYSDFRRPGLYRDVAYMRAQCEQLATQLSAMTVFNPGDDE